MVSNFKVNNIEIRKIGTRFLVSVFVTAIVYFDFLGGSVQSFPGIVAIVVSLVVGILGAVLSQYAKSWAKSQQYVDNNVLFLVVMVISVLFLLVIFPRGIPETAAIGFIFLIWAMFFSELVLSSIE
ncbi:hypothetical protein [Natronomonas marina]|jgi:hypothetical protein|uniref:hypothetical protein n=1 Tax=Natronomonas marina TaxID=2961939 RepID=UPI0020C982EE|nr:hypothetical protein [Natronomonas marina]